MFQYAIPLFCIPEARRAILRDEVRDETQHPRWDLRDVGDFRHYLSFLRKAPEKKFELRGLVRLSCTASESRSLLRVTRALYF